ncbi:neocarzinostatin family protein [Mumia flava]|uniref:Neocarzinostatin family protein n=1 Tax=Mumia flava TaxID=1348852 RepID=A0A0B2BLL1_9ACTN|nr:neocarzinostatin apoprotein domain-containing protein [Mumia flava]PJJ56352.1 neocarzinostatin family protein [Mumia flava]
MTSNLIRAVRGLLGALALGVVMLVAAPAASAAPQLDVSETTGLSDGQSITVDGSGFDPNLEGIAVGQCKEGFTGPSDCNLQGGATFRNADGSGTIATVTLKLAESFNGIDCTTQQCVIGAAPLPTASSQAVVDANTAIVPLEFGAAAGGGAEEASAPAEAPAQAPAEAAPAQADAGALPKTGPTDSLPVLLLAGAALVLPGAALMLALPSRRRSGAGA